MAKKTPQQNDQPSAQRPPSGAPVIRIKKADGSIATVPLDQFKKQYTDSSKQAPTTSPSATPASPAGRPSPSAAESTPPAAPAYAKVSAGKPASPAGRPAVAVPPPLQRVKNKLKLNFSSSSKKSVAPTPPDVEKESPKEIPTPEKKVVPPAPMPAKEKVSKELPKKIETPQAVPAQEDEFLSFEGQVPPPPPVRMTKEKVERSPTDMLAETATHALSTTTPVAHAFVDAAAAKAWDKEDHSSPLEMSMHEHEEVPDHLPALPEQHDEVLDEVLHSLSFQISEELHSRVKSLIQSRLKEIRTDDQIIAYGVRPAQQGGLGLKQEEAKILLDAILNALHLPHQKRKKEEKRKQVKSSIPIAPPIQTSQKAPVANVAPRPRAVPLKSTGKPMVHDVQHPEPVTHMQTVGPIDELRMFSLEDLRRLGTTPDAMYQKLLEKFTILQKESYLLYIDAVQAWYHSPLYRLYQSLLQQAINNEKPMKDIIQSQGKGSITMDEFLHIAELGKNISY